MVIPMEKPDRFPTCLAFVLKWEGGYCDDKDDPGGETKYGICKRSFPSLDIKNLTVEQAGEIYREHYWKRAGCDALPAGLDLAAFDVAVNTGVGNVKPWLEETKGDLNAFIARRVLYYFRVVQKRPISKKFLKGWLNRVADLAAQVIQ